MGRDVFNHKNSNTPHPQDKVLRPDLDPMAFTRLLGGLPLRDDRLNWKETQDEACELRN